MSENSDNANIPEWISKNADELMLPPEVYISILNTSIEEGDRDQEALEQAFSSENIDEIQSLSHRLKGALGNLRLTSVAQPAVELNDLAKQKAPISEMKPKFEIFKSEYAKLKQSAASLPDVES
ncbi:MAG: Hpt domain-containing protein [Candidatus Omnitrophica bacterium]|nr:Hpt domain-containing protein [Candidatus Omnitrophota bacterium]